MQAWIGKKKIWNILYLWNTHTYMIYCSFVHALLFFAWRAVLDSPVYETIKSRTVKVDWTYIEYLRESFSFSKREKHSLLYHCSSRELKCNFEFAEKTKRVYTRATLSLQRAQTSTSSIARNETSSAELDRSNSYSASFPLRDRAERVQFGIVESTSS